MQVEAYMDYVIIAKQRVERPSHVSRSAWMAYWEVLQWSSKKL